MTITQGLVFYEQICLKWYLQEVSLLFRRIFCTRVEVRGWRGEGVVKGWKGWRYEGVKGRKGWRRGERGERGEEERIFYPMWGEGDGEGWKMKKNWYIFRCCSRCRTSCDFRRCRIAWYFPQCHRPGHDILHQCSFRIWSNNRRWREIKITVDLGCGLVRNKNARYGELPLCQLWVNYSLLEQHTTNAKKHKHKHTNEHKQTHQQKKMSCNNFE